MEETNEITIYRGPRDHTFRSFIRGLLSQGSLKTHYIDVLTDDEAMETYSTVFTSPTGDPDTNYEVFEQLGDVTANKFLVWYMHRRFPQLKCPKGVKVVARLRINYSSKQSFAPIAEMLGFWSFITASDDERSRNKRPLLEDTLEAFIGATEYLIDTRIKTCVGYAIVYDILSAIFNKKEISLKYEDLYDAKTRLKELFDFFGNETLGSLKYVDEKNIEEKLTTSKAYQNTIQGNILLGQGVAALKADAQQKAALNALENLKRRGYIKPVPEIYAYFNNMI